MNVRGVLLVASTNVGQVGQPLLLTCSRFNENILFQDVTSHASSHEVDCVGESGWEGAIAKVPVLSTVTNA
jgi:hypothetical protein